jgi:hypothetical protein
MRDHLAHRYFDTAHAILQATVDEDLPALERAVRELTVPPRRRPGRRSSPEVSGGPHASAAESAVRQGSSTQRVTPFSSHRAPSVGARVWISHDYWTVTESHRYV